LSASVFFCATTFLLFAAKERRRPAETGHHASRRGPQATGLMVRNGAAPRTKDTRYTFTAADNKTKHAAQMVPRNEREGSARPADFLLSPRAHTTMVPGCLALSFFSTRSANNKTHGENAGCVWARANSPALTLPKGIGRVSCESARLGRFCVIASARRSQSFASAPVVALFAQRLEHAVMLHESTLCGIHPSDYSRRATSNLMFQKYARTEHSKAL
jgi:hypothetical protein